MPHRKLPSRSPTRRRPPTTRTPIKPRRPGPGPRPTPMPRLPIGGGKKSVIAKHLRQKSMVRIKRQKHLIRKLRDVKKQKRRA